MKVIFTNGTEMKINPDVKISGYFSGKIECEISGDTAYYKNGSLHRLDGPSIENTRYYNIEEQFHIDGENFDVSELNNGIILDSYQGKYDLTWYKVLTNNGIKEFPEIPGMILGK